MITTAVARTVRLVNYMAIRKYLPPPAAVVVCYIIMHMLITTNNITRQPGTCMFGSAVAAGGGEIESPCMQCMSTMPSPPTINYYYETSMHAALKQL